MKFIALDVETANSDCGSICQVGIATFEENAISDTWETLVNPRDYFSSFNISIHGINRGQVLEAPTFEEIFCVLEDKLKDQVVLHHTAFDKRALSRAAQKYGLELFQARWLDTAKVVRRTWQKYAVRGYSLKNVARELGISFNHHDALEDAIAAGKIMVHVLEESGLSLDHWLDLVDKPRKKRRFTV
ncbi:MAG: transposase [Candidatus Syntrophonatronum acetioxidans]|uniref:Transposase n=1 Tax=Candidatus Syntrophonatronum acetioxidans TaxID=1795816 RepID=A0A424YER8_9FIRM|nr:MAG: transposase [Candidatus Syntrophonatronum acetioxidans]